MPSLFKLPAVEAADLPELPVLAEAERLAWDLETHDAARRHPMMLLRRALADLEVRPVEPCYRLGRAFRLWLDGPPPVVTTAGLVVLRQRPPTAKGVLFLTVEDESGFLQCVVRPEAVQALGSVLQACSSCRGRSRWRATGDGWY